jgi:hypothetical protein
MVLGTVRREAGAREREPNAFKTNLTQGGPSGSHPVGHSDSLKKSHITLSQGMLMKRVEAVVNDDDDAVRTSVSQNRVTAPHCVLRNCFSGLSIYSSLHISHR